MKDTGSGSSHDVVMTKMLLHLLTDLNEPLLRIGFCVCSNLKLYEIAELVRQRTNFIKNDFNIVVYAINIVVDHFQVVVQRTNVAIDVTQTSLNSP